MNLNWSKEKFEERMAVKMTIESIIKALLKSKTTYSFELIYSHGLVPGITSLSMFLLMRPESLLLAVLAKSFIRKLVLVFLQMGNVSFRKMEIVFYTWNDNHHIKSSSSHLNYQGQCLAG